MALFLEAVAVWPTATEFDSAAVALEPIAIAASLFAWAYGPTATVKLASALV